VLPRIALRFILLEKQGLVSFKTSATLTALLIQSGQMTDLAATPQMQQAKGEQAKGVLLKFFANPKNGARKSKQSSPVSISPPAAAGRLESAFNNRSI
jgi:hypothetical protein